MSVFFRHQYYLNEAITVTRLSTNIFTAKAKSITPKNFRKINMVAFPRTLSILSIEANTINANSTLRTKAIIMFITAWSARNESKAVNAPGPAISGNAIGTIDAPLPPP